MDWQDWQKRLSDSYILAENWVESHGVVMRGVQGSSDEALARLVVQVRRKLPLFASGPLVPFRAQELASWLIRLTADIDGYRVWRRALSGPVSQALSGPVKAWLGSDAPFNFVLEMRDALRDLPPAAVVPAPSSMPPSAVIADDPDDYDAWIVEVASHEPTHKLPKFPPPGYYDTPRWKSLSAEVRKAWGYKCALCGTADIVTEVHHNSYQNLFHEKFFDLIPLCEQCHERHSVAVATVEERVDAELRRLIAASKKRKVDA